MDNSIDAAVSHMRKTLPGWHYSVSSMDGVSRGSVWRDWRKGEDHVASADTPAEALRAAVQKALG